MVAQYSRHGWVDHLGHTLVDSVAGESSRHHVPLLLQHLRHITQTNHQVRQEAQLSQRDRAMLYVTEYFAATQGHSRSLKLAPFESVGTVSYPPSIVTMAPSRIVSETKNEILVDFSPHRPQ